MAPQVLNFVIYLIGLGVLLLSKNLTLNIFVGIIMIIGIALSQIKNNNTHKNLIVELKNTNEYFLTYKESIKPKILFSLAMITNCVLIINTKLIDKNIELIHNNEREISGIVEYIKTVTPEEISRIVIWGVLIVIFSILLLQCLNNIVIVNDSNIFFKDNTIINIDEIVKIEYKHQYFSFNKVRILEIRTKNTIKKIVVDKNDDSLKTHLESL